MNASLLERCLDRGGKKKKRLCKQKGGGFYEGVFVPRLYKGVCVLNAIEFKELSLSPVVF